MDIGNRTFTFLKHLLNNAFGLSAVIISNSFGRTETTRLGGEIFVKLIFIFFLLILLPSCLPFVTRIHPFSTGRLFSALP